jgi:hypothetical protein
MAGRMQCLVRSTLAVVPRYNEAVRISYLVRLGSGAHKELIENPRYVFLKG